jgi:hypothetical protein
MAFETSEKPHFLLNRLNRHFPEGTPSEIFSSEHEAAIARLTQLVEPLLRSEVGSNYTAIFNFELHKLSVSLLFFSRYNMRSTSFPKRTSLYSENVRQCFVILRSVPPRIDYLHEATEKKPSSHTSRNGFLCQHSFMTNCHATYRCG